MNYIILIHHSQFTGDTYSDCVEPVRRPQSCKPYESLKSYRRFDGLCNHLRFPTVGAANKPFRRVISKSVILEDKNVKHKVLTRFLSKRLVGFFSNL